MLEKRLNAIKKFYFKNKRLPSYEEMLSLFDVSSKNSVFKVIGQLVEDGFISKKDGKLAPTSRFFALPLLGMVKAGYPILSEEQKKYLTLDEYLIEDPTSSFLLTVSGDSLIDLGIYEGDIVIIKRGNTVRPGMIILAEIDGQWTLKIYRLDKNTNKPYLESANTNYPPFFPLRELKIHGSVQAVIRKLH